MPTLAKYLLRKHDEPSASTELVSEPPPSRNPLVRLQHGFEAQFLHLRDGYRGLLALAIAHRRAFVGGFLGIVAASFLLTPFLGRNFFPQVDGGQILLHGRQPSRWRQQPSTGLLI